MELKTFVFLLTLLRCGEAGAFVSPSRHTRKQPHRDSIQRQAVATPMADATMIGPHLPINEDFPGLQRVHYNPDIYVIENFLDPKSCDDMMARAGEKNMGQSPVAYAGWTSDFKDLFELAAKGPVAWLSLIGAWWQLKDSAEASQVGLVIDAVQNYLGLLLVATGAIAAFTKSRADSLQGLRTSTSTTLDDMKASPGACKFVQQAADLFRGQPDREPAYFEAPTVIRYEPGQQLAPHFDANRSAAAEDANRGGQTLATLILYLNDVGEGGLTRFGRLKTENQEPLIVRPLRGDALLFFPADAAGRFDERTEHEGCPAVDEKWIARIWRHESAVPPPFGLSEKELSMFGN